MNRAELISYLKDCVDIACDDSNLNQENVLMVDVLFTLSIIMLKVVDETVGEDSQNDMIEGLKKVVDYLPTQLAMIKDYDAHQANPYSFP